MRRQSSVTNVRSSTSSTSIPRRRRRRRRPYINRLSLLNPDKKTKREDTVVTSKLAFLNCKNSNFANDNVECGGVTFGNHVTAGRQYGNNNFSNPPALPINKRNISGSISTHRIFKPQRESRQLLKSPPFTSLQKDSLMKTIEDLHECYFSKEYRCPATEILKDNNDKNNDKNNFCNAMIKNVWCEEGSRSSNSFVVGAKDVEGSDNLFVTFDYGFSDSIEQQDFNRSHYHDSDGEEAVQVWQSPPTQAGCDVAQFPVHRMRHNIEGTDISFLSTLTEYDVDDGEEVLGGYRAQNVCRNGRDFNAARRDSGREDEEEFDDSFNSKPH